MKISDIITSKQYVLYLNNKPVSTYNNLKDARGEVYQLQINNPNLNFEIRQEICKTEPLPLDLKEIKQGLAEARSPEEFMSQLRGTAPDIKQVYQKYLKSPHYRPFRTSDDDTREYQIWTDNFAQFLRKEFGHMPQDLAFEIGNHLYDYIKMRNREDPEGVAEGIFDFKKQPMPEHGDELKIGDRYVIFDDGGSHYGVSWIKQDRSEAYEEFNKSEYTNLNQLKKAIWDEIKYQDQRGVAEGKKPDRYHIVGKDGKPADLASYPDRASAEQVRDKKYPDAVVQQVGPRGKVKGVTEQAQICSECGGPSYSNPMLAEKKDACYHKVKSRVKVWPSAYASGQLVQCRKRGASNWGTGGKKK